MPELRRDPVTGRWIIVATERARRPQDFRGEPQVASAKACPFCEGKEEGTPPEIVAIAARDRRPNAPGWRVRVVPNKFPALQVEGHLEPRGNGLYDVMNGVGAHEVIIESPHHTVSVTDLPLLRDVFWAYRERLADLKQDRRLLYGLIFKNVGPSAGATVEHAHSQLICTPVVPKTVLEEIGRTSEYHRFHGRCLFCDMVRQEVSDYARLVKETEHFVAFCPFAARFPFETWVLPKRHRSHFEDTPRNELDQLAEIVRIAIAKLERALERPAYNYLVHTAPFDRPAMEAYHWHVEIIPRLTRVAGFEWGTDFYVNPVSSESAAEYLRSVEV
jgi:UDPglucose--hexose-1-phosphate uridylyltransferase